MPYHRAIDRAREARLGKQRHRHHRLRHRSGLRRQDVAHRACASTTSRSSRRSRKSSKRNIRDKNLYLKAVLKAKPIDGAEIVEQMRKVRTRLTALSRATLRSSSHDAIAAGKRILFEGAHGVMLDIDHGTYPFVTSSNCGASAVFGGAGIAPGRLDAVLGISKAYTTRVGGGPFPSEIKGKLGDALRDRGRRIRQRDRPAAAHRMVRRGARAPCDRGSTACGAWR